MIGCERCAQFHRHFYDREPVQVDYCPRNLTGDRSSTPVTTEGSTTFTIGGGVPATMEKSALILTKCCLLETTIECEGTRAVVPWGANLRHVEEALRYLVSREMGETREPAAELSQTGDC